MDRLIQTALQSKPVAWFGPTLKIIADTWRQLCAILAPVTLHKNEQEKRLELLGGGSIELWSLDSADAGRGRKYALVVIDEAAMIANLEESWPQSIRPTLTDLIGEAWILSTPKGMNYFKTLFDRGPDPEQKEYASFQMPTSTNPAIDPGEIEAARHDLSEAAFNQEYLALFINWEGSVFRRVTEAATAPAGLEPQRDHEYIIGCDWGRSQDFTVFVVVDTTTRCMVAMERSHQIDYTLQCARLGVLAERWQPKQIIAEQNSIGQPVIEQLTRDGLRVEPFTMTHASKAQVIESLALAFERADIRILNDPVLLGELLAYQAERLPSGLLRYGAPAGHHDDCVTALAIAWTAASTPRRPVYDVDESDLVMRPFRIPDYWPRVFGMEVGPCSVAAIWLARDPVSGTLYAYDEYRSTCVDPTLHTREILARGSWIPGVMDPSGNGRNPSDGGRVIDMYRDDFRLKLEWAESKLLAAGIMAVNRLMSLGKLKVFDTLTNYRDELRQYRRDDTGQVISGNDQLQNALRYAVVSGISRMGTKPVPNEFAHMYRSSGILPGTQGGWMG